MLQRFAWVPAETLLQFIEQQKGKEKVQQEGLLLGSTDMLIYSKFVKTLLNSEGEKVIREIMEMEKNPELIKKLCPRWLSMDLQTQFFPVFTFSSTVEETTLCKFYSKGLNCKYLNHCKFLHVR